MIPRTGRLLALDWGEVRIGVAVSDETQLIASPRATLTRRAGKRFPMPPFLALVGQERPVGLIVGLPLTAEGSEGAAARSAREMGTLVSARTALPLEFVDERFSTARALGAIREMDGTTRGRKHDVDALAAAVLLQHYLDTRRNQP